MKFIKMLLIAFFSIFIISYATIENNLVSADDDYEEKYETHEDKDDGEEAYEDLGETVGWGTIIAMGTAGLIFPIRRSSKSIITNYPKSKKAVLSISKFVGKYHLFIGTIALTMGIIHGVTMYLSEGNLESEGIIGLGAFLLMMLAAFFGTILFKNKKMKSLRTIHTALIAVTFLVGFIHIISS